MSTSWMNQFDKAEIPLSQRDDLTAEQKFEIEKADAVRRSKIEQDDHVAVGDGETPWWAPWMGEQATTLPGKMDVSEALNYSGLAGWDLSKVPMYTQIDSGYGQEYDRVPEFYAIRRATDNKVLGVAKGRYRIVQNETAFAWAQSLLGDTAVEKITGKPEAGAYFTSAGSLRGGRVVFLAARTPFDVELSTGPTTKPDNLETYLLITNRHDGSGSVICAIVTIRVVCQNTLDRSLNGSLGMVKIRHTVNAHDRLDMARATLGLAKGASERARAAALALMAKSAGNALDRSKFLAALLPIPTEDVGKRTVAAIMRRREEIEDVYLNHPTLRNLDDNCWRLYNAVTFYHDHVTPRRSHPTDSGGPEANRLDAILAGQNLGTRAYELLGGPSYRELAAVQS